MDEAEEFGTLLRQLRGQRSIRDVSLLAAVSKSQISEFERGQRVPTESAAAALDRALDAGGRLIAKASRQRTAPVEDHAAELRAGVVETLAGNGMTDAGAEDWQYTVRRHAAATRWRPEAVHLPELLADLADLYPLTRRAHTPRVRRQLLTCLAELSGLVALTSLKLGNTASARDWWRTSRAAAGAAEDRATMSWCYAQEAYQSYYDGDIPSALELAGHAQHIAGGLPCVGPALAAPLEARAHAVLGRGDRAASAIAAARTALDRLDPAHQTASALGYTEANRLFHAGDAWTHLGDTHRARDELTCARGLYPESDVTDRTLIDFDLAACHVADGRPDAAADLVARTLSGLPTDHRSGLIIYRARQVAKTVPEGAPRRVLADVLDLPET